VAALAGLTILTAFVDALQTAIATDLPMGSFFALAIAASPLTLFGVGSAFWALVGGVLASLVVERPMLIRTLRVPDRGCDQ
jgi:benzoate membrane transport protein